MPPSSTPFAPAPGASSSARSRRTSPPGTRPRPFPRELYAEAAAAGLLGLGYPEELRRHAGADAAAPRRHRGGRARRQRRPDGQPVLALDRPAADRRPRQRGAASGASCPTCSPARRSRPWPITEPGGGSDVARARLQRAARGRRLGDRRREDLHHLGPARRLDHGRGAHRRARARAASRSSPCPATRPASNARRSPRWAGGAATPRSCASTACRVPADHLIGEENAGFRIDHGATSTASGCCMSAWRCGFAAGLLRRGARLGARAQDLRRGAGRAPGDPPQADGHADAHRQQPQAWLADAGRRGTTPAKPTTRNGWPSSAC